MFFKSSFVLVLIAMLGIFETSAFCGFYVAKADTKLFNETSQVILVRDGKRSIITMSNDFKGDAADFAMVVPVPVVLQEQDIRVVNQLIFDRFDAYSAPRLAEYYDENPCYIYDYEEELEESMTESAAPTDDFDMDLRPSNELGVTIEAKYTVGEYDILILSAKESEGLKEWLTINDYKIPEGAEEVLNPYIKSNLKFFVVKVNMEEQKKTGFNTLRPLQISFESDKFMLPIRLGMANAKGDQDMVVYAFTKNGRVETTNYRTVKLPADNNIPEFIQNDFGDFYKDVFARAYKKESGRAVFLEYAWDLSASNVQKCDPCVTPPPILADMVEAGVDWLNIPNNTFSSQYSGNVFFTRLHVRYNRKNFPQDLMFQETPNKDRFQCRYVIHHPATGDLSCEEGQYYLKDLVKRREKELHELARLTGWSVMKYKDYVSTYANMIKGEPTPEEIAPQPVKKVEVIEPTPATSTPDQPENPDQTPALNSTLAANTEVPEAAEQRPQQEAPVPTLANPAWHTNPWILGSIFLVALALLLKVLGFPRSKKS